MNDRLWKVLAYASRLDLNQTYKQFCEAMDETEDDEQHFSEYLYEATKLIL